MHSASIGNLAYWKLRSPALDGGSSTSTRPGAALPEAAASNSRNGVPAAPPAGPSVELRPSGELRFTRAGSFHVHATVTYYVTSGEELSFRLELLPPADDTAAMAVPLAFCSHETGTYLSLNYPYTSLAILMKKMK